MPSPAILLEIICNWKSTDVSASCGQYPFPNIRGKTKRPARFRRAGSGLWEVVESFNKALVNLYICIEAEDLRIEIQFAVERTLDVSSLAESMLLAFEWNICYGQSLSPRRVKHHLRLIGRDHFVL